MKSISHKKDFHYELSEFVAWDGEGISYPGNKTQSYILFGNSSGDYVRATAKGEDLSTEKCLELLITSERKQPDAIHVGFSIKYDVNMIVKDLPRYTLIRLFQGKWVRWRGYTLQYLEGKWFIVSKGKGKDRVSCKLFDVWGFFQSSFVVAVTSYLGSTDDRIVAGKARRSTFEWEELESYVIPYWRMELELLVDVMETLRSYLETAGFHPKSWHGPGAIANEVFTLNQIKEAKAENTPPEVLLAAQYAYAGGRFEQFKCGHYPGTVYEYDINSAYPNAIRRLPNLARGTWRLATKFRPGSFSVWKITHLEQSPKLSQIQPYPLFHRDIHGAISFPSYVSGWYWEPEAALIPVENIEYGWVFEEDDPSDRPFSFIESYYERRRKWKKEGIGAQLAYKLALNSLYGKMAQRVGWEEGRPIPRWHCLEWAGYVTSFTRSMLWNAIVIAPSAIIAVETDALFTTMPLNLTIGSGLGEWELTEFKNLTYIQSGFYYGTLTNGDEIAKYRGFEKPKLNELGEMGGLTRERVFEYLSHLDDCYTKGLPPTQTLTGYTTRFVGFKIANQSNAEWRSWERNPRDVILGGNGKRGHVASQCSACRNSIGLREGLHDLACLTPGGWSSPHFLPWSPTPNIFAGSPSPSDTLQESAEMDSATYIGEQDG